MEHHIPCNPSFIARYVFCPGDQKRARRIAEFFSNARLVIENRGYVVVSGEYDGVFMTVCGTGMGGPAVAIALEELAHMGADTFIRVGSCGVFQPFQKPGDVIISSGTVREGGTANAYLPLTYPAVPHFSVLRALVTAGETLKIPVTVGIGVASDAFYAPPDEERRKLCKQTGLVAVEMESDTLFTLGIYRGWRTGAIFTSDGTPDEIKPAWGEEAYRTGEENAIRIALTAMHTLSASDGMGYMAPFAREILP